MMNTYIALLRGINVSGHKLIKMELLRKVLEELNFSDITTYIQSGNILFRSNITDTGILEDKISAKIEEHFGFEVPVVIVTLDTLNKVMKKLPFSEAEIPDATQPYVAFLSDSPTKDNAAALGAIDFGRDKFSIDGKVVYLIYADGGAGKTKLTNNVIENKLKVRATSRNWKTVAKLITLAEAY